MVATYIEKIMHNVVCMTGVNSREITNMFLVGQLFGLVKKILTLGFS